MKNRHNKAGLVSKIGFSLTMLILVVVSLFPIVPHMKEIGLQTIGLTLLIFLPWASSFLDEISISGIKVKYRELEKRIEDISKDQLKTADEVLTMPWPVAIMGAQDRNVGTLVDESDLLSLSKKYVSIRASLPSGSPRTHQMTAIFQKMRVASEVLGEKWGGLDEWLLSDDAGRNLAAIAYLYAFPTRMKPSSVIALIDRSAQPFIQYWALRVLNFYVENHGTGVFEKCDVEHLFELEESFGPHIDRGVLIRGINRSIYKLSTKNWTI